MNKTFKFKYHYHDNKRTAKEEKRLWKLKFSEFVSRIATRARIMNGII